MASTVKQMPRQAPVAGGTARGIGSGRTPYCGLHCPPGASPPAIAQPPSRSNRPENCFPAGRCCFARRFHCPSANTGGIAIPGVQHGPRPFRATDACNELPNLWPAEGGRPKSYAGIAPGLSARARGLGRRAQAAEQSRPIASRQRSRRLPGAPPPRRRLRCAVATTGRLGRRRPGGDRNCLSRAARSRPARADLDAAVVADRSPMPLVGTTQDRSCAGSGAPGNAAVDRRQTIAEVAEPPAALRNRRTGSSDEGSAPPAPTQAPTPARQAGTRPAMAATNLEPSSRSSPSPKAPPNDIAAGKSKAGAPPEAESVAAVNAGERRATDQPTDDAKVLASALEKCGKENFLAGIICEQKAYLRYCDGKWDQVPQCTKKAEATDNCASQPHYGGQVRPGSPSAP